MKVHFPFSLDYKTVSSKHFLNKNIWQATFNLFLWFKLVQSKWMRLLRWPRFNFVLLLSEPSVLTGFLPGVKFLFALCCQKGNFTDRWNYSFFLSESQADCKFATTNKCNLCGLSDYFSLSNSVFHSWIPQFWMVILFYFCP